ncbi:MAG: hypothetical protein K2H12_04800 [Acetatifactor sp.]|nr:hypothetical protein [Acetatifactor sp.]
MKTKQKISLLILVIVIAATAILLVWYFSPRIFLEGVEPSDIKSIIVFDGNTGKGFYILAADEIRYIVENIQGNKMERDGVSIGYMGWSFQMIFCD